LKEIGVKDEDILYAGWLHDMLEDTNTNFDDIHEKFGLRVAEIVSQATKDKRLTTKD
jgi:guanosine-3',5'-bis(diphosphate) 3'-pyrophosphohydrolase